MEHYKKFNIKKISLLLICILFLGLVGCGKPKNIRKEIYDKSVEYTEVIEKAYDDHIDLTIKQYEDICDFIGDSFENEELTNEEKEILNGLLDSSGSYLFYIMNNDEKSLNEFKQYFKNLKELLDID